MPLKSTPSGYGVVTKALHWIIFVLIAAQLGVGYLLTRFDDDFYESIPGLSEDRLFGVHMSLGATVLILAIIRLAWRILTPLPAWAATLTPFERRYEHRVEQVLYFLMLAIPLSGMLAAVADGEALVFYGLFEIPEIISEDGDIDDFDDLALGFHIASHVAFFVAFALHVGLVLKHQFSNRDRLLNRML